MFKDNGMNIQELFSYLRCVEVCIYIIFSGNCITLIMEEGSFTSAKSAVDHNLSALVFNVFCIVTFICTQKWMDNVMVELKFEMTIILFGRREMGHG